MGMITNKIIAYLSLLVILLYLLTGYGMTKSETITKLTFGKLTRSLSHSIHEYLVIPLIILLLLHIILSCNILPHFKEERSLNKL